MRLFPLGLLLSLFCTSAGYAQPSPMGHRANPLDPGDLALLRANGDEVSGRVVRNSCGAPVHPVIYLPAEGVAVVVEVDPTGLCSGANDASGLVVRLRTGGTWKLSTSTPGRGFRIGAIRNGYPDIIVRTPGEQGCPVLGWTGHGYEMTQPCHRR